MRRPARDLPLGIIATLLTVTGLYVAFALVLTGMEPFAAIDPNTPAVSVRLRPLPLRPPTD